METLKFILNFIIVLLPIGYALYTKTWQPLLLVLWGTIGGFATALSTLTKKEE